MPGPIQRGRAFVERILSDGVETVNTEEGFTETVPDDDNAITNRSYVDQNEKWKTIAEADDTDNNTELSIVVNNLDNFDRYRMSLNITRDDSSGRELRMRINGIDDADYNFVGISDTIDRTDDATEFKLARRSAALDGHRSGGKWTLQPGGFLSIWGNGTTGVARQEVLFRGHLSQDVSLDSIEVFSGDEATGKIVIEGRDL